MRLEPLAALVLLSVATPAYLWPQGLGEVRVRRYGTDVILAQGTLLRRVGDSLLIDPGGGLTARRIGSDEVFERYGTRGRPVFGGIIGGTVGLFVGIALAPTREVPCNDVICWNSSEPAAGTGLVVLGSMVGGAIAGALIGSRFKKKAWVGFDPAELPDTGPRVAVVPTNGGFRSLISIPIRLGR